MTVDIMQKSDFILCHFVLNIIFSEKGTLVQHERLPGEKLHGRDGASLIVGSYFVGS